VLQLSLQHMCIEDRPELWPAAAMVVTAAMPVSMWALSSRDLHAWKPRMLLEATACSCDGFPTVWHCVVQCRMCTPFRQHR
jgi:hypothetical protein